MNLSSDLISQFVKTTNDNKKNVSSEATFFGTIVEYDGSYYAKLDGSEQLTPITTTADVVPGERVTVLLKNHSATVTGNITSPSARQSTVVALDGKVSEFGTVLADKVDTVTLRAEQARIDELYAENTTITGKLTAAEASIKTLETDNVTVNEKLTANSASIKTLEADNVTIKDTLTAQNGVIENLEADNVTINNTLTAQKASIETLEADNATINNTLTAHKASIETLEADNVTVKDTLTAHKASIETLEADNATINNTLTAHKASIETLEADNVTINNTLTAHKASIETLEADNVTIKGTLTANSASIKSLEADNVTINNTLTANSASIKTLEADNVTINNTLTAANAEIASLKADKLSATDADLKYANIDFTNIGTAAMEYFYANSGLIKDVTIGNGTITGNLIGVTISGDLIEGNTIVAEKLVIKGTDGLYYKLNTDGMTTEAEQTEYNSLNGQVIIAKSITATKISVDDLVAFDATIGGFNITESSIYSGAKASVDNTTRGVYLDNTGQVNFGDSNNYLKYYKTSDGTYKLAISADTIMFGSGNTSVETAINYAQSTANTAVANASAAQSTANAAKSAAATAQNGVDSLTTRVTAAETSITQNKEAIELRATKTEVTTVSNTANVAKTAAATAQSTANAAKSAAEAAQEDVDNLETRVTNAETKITQNADSITSIATRTTTVENKFANYSTTEEMNSAIEQKADSITSTVSSTYATKSALATTNANVTTAQSTANTAKSNAATAQTTANTANSTANTALTNTLLQSDVTNYAQLYDNTASYWGFTADSTSDGHWYTVNTLKRDIFISGWHQCSGEEKFRITFQISTSVMGNITNGGTDSVYRGTAIGIYCYNAAGTNVGIVYSTRTTGTADAPATSVSSTVTLPTSARKFRVFLQTESWGNFSGTLKVRNVRVEKIDSELEERITSAESSITQLSDKITANVTETTNLATRMSTVEQTASGLTVSLSEVDSRVTETENSLAAMDVIVGTQTAATGSWTGVANFSSLVDGQQITYWLPYAGSGNATLNLTLSTGATTGAIACYYSGTTRITTHYAAGNAIRLIYRAAANINGTTYKGWWADANYDSGNTYDRTQYYQAIKCGTTAIVAGNIIVGVSGTYTHLKLGSAFDVSYPILYAGSAISASSTGYNNYLTYPFTVTTTQSITLTAYKPVYIKGTLSSTLFTPVSTAPLTQTLPTSEDGYYYILLGTAYSTTAMYLLSEHPIFRYYNGGFKSVQQIAVEATEKASAAQSTATSASTAAASAQATADAAKKQVYHKASGTTGTSGYVGFATLTISGSYQNAPIRFELVNRSQISSNVIICFANSNGTDPSLSYIKRDGGISVWAYKSTTSTWILIAQKSEAYDTICVSDYANPYNGGVTVSWTNEFYTSLPTSNITAATVLAGKIDKSVVDNAAKTATNYLNFSSSGLCIGDMTASTLGRNVLIDSDSVDIRNGTTVLASYGDEYIYLGKNSEDTTISFCSNRGRINVTNDDLYGTYFNIDADESVSIYAPRRFYASSYMDNGGTVYGGAHIEQGVDVTTDGSTNIYTGYVGIHSYTQNTSAGTYYDSTVSILPGAVNIISNDGVNGYSVGFRTDASVNQMELLGGSIIMQNNAHLRGYKTDGVTTYSIADVSVNNNIAFGYGTYAAASNYTSIYGNKIRFYVKESGSSAGFIPYYTAGYSVTMGYAGTGYLTSSGRSVNFTVPFSVPIIGSPTVSVTSGNGFTLRQGGKYTHGSAASTTVTPDSYSAAIISTGGVRITAIFSDTTNVTNNDSIGIYWNGTITFS